MNEIEILNRSLKDFFTKEMLKIALYPLILTLLIMYIFFFFIAGDFVDSLEQSTINIQSSQVENINGEQNVTTINETYTGINIIDFLLKYSITSGIAGFLIYTVGSLFIMIFSLFIALIIIGFLTPKILSIIRKRHYSELEFKGYANIFSSIWVLVKHIFIMMVLFFILIPFYFIPIVNIVAFNIPFFYFFHKMLSFDISSTIMSDEEYALIKHKHKNEFRLKSLGLYLVSMIPFIALFTTVFFVIYLGHSYIAKLKELR